VRTAFADMQAALGPAMGGAIVQPMVAPGIELIAGTNHDPAFGPVVLVGMGGFAAELQRDTALGIPPLTGADVDRLLLSLHSSPVLFGYRNSAPVDVDALIDLLGRISCLAEDVDEIAELDCNPIVVSPDGAVVVDAKVRLVPRPPPPGPFELE
jgi:acyl-CoA synthetase (NDP forming)